MDLVVSVAICVLLIVFAGSLAALILICRQRCHHLGAGADFTDKNPILKHWPEGCVSSKGEGGPRGRTRGSSADGALTIDFELDDIFQLSPNIEKILQENQWVFDSGGLVKQCLAILRLCHAICDKISDALVLNPYNDVVDQETVDEVCMVTRRVVPRVNDLVSSMYKVGRSRETHAALLEARAAALVLAVNNLALVFRAAQRSYAAPVANVALGGEEGEEAPATTSASPMRQRTLIWLQGCLADLEQKLNELRRLAQSVTLSYYNATLTGSDDPLDQEFFNASDDKISTAPTAETA